MARTNVHAVPGADVPETSTAQGAADFRIRPPNVLDSFPIAAPQFSFRDKPLEVQPAFLAMTVVAALHHQAEAAHLDEMRRGIKFFQCPPGVEVKKEVAAGPERPYAKPPRLMKTVASKHRPTDLSVSTVTCHAASRNTSAKTYLLQYRYSYCMNRRSC